MAARAGGDIPVNAGPTAERVYETLKHAIMERAFRPGDRLDPAVLAERFNASTTPVREALDRLVGEDLVESRAGSGFHVPGLDEPGLKDMYAWSAELLMLAVREWPRAGSAPPLLVPAAGEPQAEQAVAWRIGLLFAAIARRSVNSEHACAVQRINARLHAARVVEPLLIADVDEELTILEGFCRGGDRRSLGRGIAAYHRRRIRLAAGIVRALYRAD
jgi:DNA-binding FadR family transcriptional regulator